MGSEDGRPLTESVELNGDGSDERVGRSGHIGALLIVTSLIRLLEALLMIRPAAGRSIRQRVLWT
jgi:hypothetical protein